MNFDDAIKAHSNWKIKLSSYISKPDGSINKSQVAQDNLCDLGKWLYGEGRRFSNDPDYQNLLKQHARFHKAAANVVAKAESGVNVTQELQLGASSEFSLASSEVVISIMKMKRKV
jgi:methyl-accepting chemotaxis protein